MVDQDTSGDHLSNSRLQTSRRATIPNGLRELVAKYIVDQGHTPKEAAIAFGLKANTTCQIASVYQMQGRTISLPRGGQQRQKLDNDMKNQICEWVDKECTIPLTILAQRASMTFGISIGRKTIERCLKMFHYTLKRTSLVPALRNDLSTLEMQMDFVSEVVSIDPAAFVFVDEVGFCYTLRLNRGRSASGERANSRVPTICS
jgi:transposase